MFHLRDRIEEAKMSLGDLDSVLQMNAREILKHKSIFEQPMTENWWWNLKTWQRLAKQSGSFSKIRKPLRKDFAYT
ncbi:MAG: hypothetical protein HY960_14910 [Ignavibacteriae bacterium]|nr:hypothetical protein [Ignavibacteriota bacterium]